MLGLRNFVDAVGIAGQISTGHLNTWGVNSAKVTIKWWYYQIISARIDGVHLLNYWMKKYKFLIIKVTKSWGASKFTA